MDYAKVKAKDIELLAANPGWTDQQILDEMNAETVPRNKTSLTGSQVLNAIDKAEYNTKTDAEKVLIWNVLHLGDLNPFGIEADLLQDVFGSSTTITALQALRVETVSWATSEGMGQIVLGHLENARM